MHDSDSDHDDTHFGDKDKHNHNSEMNEIQRQITAKIKKNFSLKVEANRKLRLLMKLKDGNSKLAEIENIFGPDFSDIAKDYNTVDKLIINFGINYLKGEVIHHKEIQGFITSFLDDIEGLITISLSIKKIMRANQSTYLHLDMVTPEVYNKAIKFITPLSKFIDKMNYKLDTAHHKYIKEVKKIAYIKCPFLKIESQIDISNLKGINLIITIIIINQNLQSKWKLKML